MDRAEQRSIRCECGESAYNAVINSFAGSTFMNLTITCPSCQRTLRVPENLLGQAVKCPSCSHTFTAPDSIQEEVPRRSPVPPPDHEYDDEPQSSKRRPPVDDYDEDYEDAPRRRRVEKPGKVQTIAIMMLIGGILATLSAVILMVSIYGLCWPGTYYSLVLGIMAIIRASHLLGENARRQPEPKGIGIMMIINVINCDVPNLVMGILVVVFLGDPEVKNYFRS